ncbi:MAG: hypothetical protein ACXWDI_15665 [Nocardioides sp.]
MTLSLDDTSTRRRIGRFAWVMAWIGLVVGQVHALARHATADGKEDLELAWTAAWAEPAARVLRPLLEWGDPDLVYVTYGKVWFPVFLAFTLAALVAYRLRRPARFEKWVWRVTLTGYVLGTLATFLDYWTQWTGDYNLLFDVGWLVTVPAFLLTMVGSTALGVTLLVRGFRPRVPALLLALVLPLAFVILSVTSMGSAALPIMFAFGLLGRRTARADGVRPGEAQNVTVGGASWSAGAS